MKEQQGANTAGHLLHGRERMHTWPSRGARLEEEDAMKYTNNTMVIVQVDTYRALIMH